MSYMKTTSLCCDGCGYWDDFGLQQPATPGELVKRARKRGWSCSVPRRDPVDLCGNCTKDERRKAVERL